MKKGKFTITIKENDIHYTHFKKRFEERIGIDLSFSEYISYQNMWDKSVPYSKKGSKAFTLRIKNKGTTTVKKANLIFNKQKRLATIIPVKWNEPLLQNTYNNKKEAKKLLSNGK